MSMQNGAAEAACYFMSVQACLMTLLYKHSVNHPSKVLLGVHEQRVITQLA
jgi:hypothetical protein